MRNVRIFKLYLQHVFNFRSRIFVWFLIPLINPLLLVAYWKGAYAEGNPTQGEWAFSSLITYYLMLIIANSILMAHIEEDVAILDIQRGGLIKYLLKPFSYYWMKFFDELPWRLIQGMFGLSALLFFWLLYGRNISYDPTLLNFAMVIPLALGGFMLAFTFKMVLGLTAFWLTDFRGLQQIAEILILIFAGTVIPLNLFPDFLSSIAYLLPFAYMIYFPVMGFLGKLNGIEVMKVLIGQMFWLFGLVSFYQLLWNLGVKKFTGVGQ